MQTGARLAKVQPDSSSMGMWCSGCCPYSLQEADELDSKAKQAQQEALTVVRQAVEPERMR